MTSSERLRAVAVGAAGGLLATVLMSALMLVAKRAGLTGELPPEKIADALVDQLAAEWVPESQRDAVAVAGHFGFGAAAGALYGLLAAPLRDGRLAALAGTAYGTAVWTVSYLGWVPALGIMAPAQRDRPGRVATMIAAHWVFGSVLGALTVLGLRRR